MFIHDLDIFIRGKRDALGNIVFHHDLCPGAFDIIEDLSGQASVELCDR
jgi:hypothetical protein